MKAEGKNSFVVLMCLLCKGALMMGMKGGGGGSDLVLSGTHQPTSPRSAGMKTKADSKEEKREREEEGWGKEEDGSAMGRGRRKMDGG